MDVTLVEECLEFWTELGVVVRDEVAMSLAMEVNLLLMQSRR